MMTYFIDATHRMVGYRDGWDRPALMMHPAEATRHIHTNERCPIMERYRNRTLISMDTSGLVMAMRKDKLCPYCDGKVPAPALEDDPKVKEWMDAFRKAGLEPDPIICGGLANRKAWPSKDAWDQALAGEVLRLQNLKTAKVVP